MRTVLLYSGGLDSHLLWLLDRPKRVMFDMGDRQSWAAIDRARERPGAEDASVIQWAFDGYDKFCDGFVAYRNMLFIIQTTLEYPGPLRIWIGQTLEWQVDKNAGFYRMMRRIAREHGRRNVVIEAPLARMTKSEAIAYVKNVRPVGCEQLVEHTHSCLIEVEKHCGKCSSCINRWIALRNNGLHDPSFVTEPTRKDYTRNAHEQRALFRPQNAAMYLRRGVEAMAAFTRSRAEGPWRSC